MDVLIAIALADVVIVLGGALLLVVTGMRDRK